MKAQRDASCIGCCNSRRRIARPPAGFFCEQKCGVTDFSTEQCSYNVPAYRVPDSTLQTIVLEIRRRRDRRRLHLVRNPDKRATGRGEDGYRPLQKSIRITTRRDVGRLTSANPASAKMLRLPT